MKSISLIFVQQPRMFILVCLCILLIFEPEIRCNIFTSYLLQLSLIVFFLFFYLSQVNIKRRGNHVPGSPIEVMVGAGKKKPGYDVGFEIPGIRLPDDLKYLKGSLIPPSGGEEPIELKAGPNNTIVVSFVPKEAGKHLIHIKRNGKDVGDSPYVVIVKPEDVALGKPDASKVKCSGPGM